MLDIFWVGGGNWRDFLVSFQNGFLFRGFTDFILGVNTKFLPHLGVQIYD